MKAEKRSEILSSLDTLLDKERAVLLEGNLTQIQAIMDEKTNLIDTLRALDIGAAHGLDDLKDKAQRNQILLDGTLAGIRRVSDRLAELRKIRHSFDTYDNSGRRHTIEGHVVHKVEKRA